MLKPPIESDVHVPYNLILTLARLAPRGSEAEYIRGKLKEYGYLDKTEKGLVKRIDYVLTWAEDFAEELQEVTLTPQEVEMVSAVVEALRSAQTIDDYQGAAFTAAKTHGWKPGEVFPLIYRILVGKTRGPRLGPYIALLGKDKVITELESALKRTA